MTNTDEKKLIRTVTIRITEAEHARLAERAEENGSTVSQAARWLLFRKGLANASRLPSEDSRPATEQTCRAYLRLYRNSCSELAKTCEKILESGAADETHVMHRMLPEIVKLQRQQYDILVRAFTGNPNASYDLLRECSEAEPHLPETADGDTAGKHGKEQKKDLKKYYYMQKITICGAIAADAEPFTSKNGADMYAFTVTCEEKGEKTSYDVYAIRYLVADIVPMLKARRQVFVTGTFRVRSATSRSGAIQNPLSISADSVTLGMEELG